MIKADLLDPLSFVSAVARFVEMIRESNDSVILTSLGFSLLLVGILAIAKLAGKGPQDTPKWLVATAIGSLVCGVLFAAGGPGLALMRKPQIETVPPSTSLARLKRNDRVEWLVRLIAYNPKSEHDRNSLAIGKLKSLGPEDVEYTFVAPYDELKGYPVGEALRRSGAQVPKAGSFRVSGIIFPVTERIYPGNSRGLLQVIKSIEDEHPEFQTKIVDTKNFSQDEIDDLTPTHDRSAQNTLIGSYNFSTWSRNYTKYCRIIHKFRCARDTEATRKKSLLSRISEDWHPIGASIKHESAASVCSTGDSYCDQAEWGKIEEAIGSKFGVRIFLVRNTKLDDLDKRYLIDFGDEKQLIPEIGASALSR